MRPSKSRAEELQARLKQKIQAPVPALCILGLAMFSVGVAKAFNWKIALFVFIILVTAFQTGSRLFQRVFNPDVGKSSEMKRLDRTSVRSEHAVSNSNGKKIA